MSDCAEKAERWYVSNALCIYVHMYVYVVRSVCELIVAACRLEDITAREKGDIRKRTIVLWPTLGRM